MSLETAIINALTQIGVDVGQITNKTDFITITAAANIDDMQASIAALDQAVVLKGEFSPSGGVFPGTGAAQAGFAWIASDAGTIDGVEINQGDRLIAITDDASTTTYLANWFLSDGSDAVFSVNGRIGAVTGLQEEMTPATERFSASASLSLTDAPISKAHVEVFFDGVFQDPDDYTLASSTITITAGSPVGVTNVFVRYWHS